MTSARSARLIWCICAAAAVFALHCTLLSPGIPAYHHDWVWPFDAWQLREAIRMNIAAWQPVGLGAPNVAPVNHPIFWFWYFASFWLPPQAIIKITLLGIFAMYAAGVAYSARRMTNGSPVVCALCGSIALLGPPIFNKLLAGHINFLIALACFSWVIYFLLDAEKSNRNLMFAGALTALAVLQIQIFVLAELVLAAAAFAAARRGRILIAGGALALSVSLSLSQLWNLYTGEVVGFFSPMQTLTHWEIINSAPFPQALIGLGYFTHYAENAYAALSWGAYVEQLLWIVPIAAIAGVAYNRTKSAFLLWSSFMVLQALVIGLRGPLGPALAAAFKSGLAFSVLRELYHFEPPAWSILCILAALGLTRLPGRAATAVLVAAVIGAGAAWLPSNYANQLFAFTASRATLTSIERIGSTAGAWSVLMLPANTPIAQGRTAGADPYAYPIGAHPTLNTYRLSGLAEVAASYGNRMGGQAWTFRRLMGAGALVERPELHSNLSGRYEKPVFEPAWITGFLHGQLSKPITPAYRLSPTCMLCAYSSLPIIRNVDQFQNGVGFVLARDALPPVLTDPDRLPVNRLIDPRTDNQNADPSLGWVEKNQWDFMDRRIALMPSGVLTWSSHPLAVPHTVGTTFVRVLVLHGYMSAGSTLLHAPIGRAEWIRLPQKAGQLRVHNGLAVVQSFAQLPGYSPTVIPRSSSLPQEFALSFDWHSESGSGAVPTGTQWIVLKQRFSRAFSLQVRGGRVIRHVPVDGFANGWQIQGPDAMRVQLAYANAPAITILEWFGLMIWLAAVCQLALTSFRRKPQREPI